MTHRKSVGTIIVALVVIGLLFLIGSAVYRSGWSQGYMMGRLSSGGEEGAAMPFTPYAFGTPRGHSFGKILLIGGLVVLGIMAFKFFRFHAWRTARGQRWPEQGEADHPQAHWAHHWHGPMPPWWSGRPPQAEAPPAPAEEAEEQPPEAEE